MDTQGASMHPLDAAFCRPMNPQHPFLNGASDAASQVKEREEEKKNAASVL
jgi:hypothetical protein